MHCVAGKLRPRPEHSSGLGGRAAWIAIASALLLAGAADCALALDPQRALTQTYVRKWQMPQGLPQPTIFKIMQSSQGYLWLGTRSGLFHFDGVRFVEPSGAGAFSLHDLWIHDLCEDRQHNLWIGSSDRGLFRLNSEGIARFGAEQGIPSESIHALLLDREGALWVATDSGLVRQMPGEESFAAALPTSSETTLGRVQALCEAADGTIWIAREDARLSLWNGQVLSDQALTYLSGRASIRALLGSADGSVWVGTTVGLVQVRHPVRNGDGRERRLSRTDGLADDAVECLAQSRDGTIWVGTRDGLSRIQEGGIESFRTRDGLSQSTVFTLFEDREGSIWAGTKHGLNQFVDRRTVPLTQSEGLPSDDTGPLLQDGTGAIWIGTLGQGLGSSDGRHCSLALGTAEGLVSGNVLALAAGPEGALWIGTDRGLTVVRNGGVDSSFTTDRGLPADEIRCLCRDRRGTLWAGTGAGLAALEGDRFVQPAGDSHVLQMPVVALAEYEGALVASMGEGGLYRCVDKRVVPFGERDGDPRDVDAFFVDRDGALWMGTQGQGLWLYSGNEKHRFEIRDGLYDDEIFGIVADDDDRLWMACSRGIFFVSRADLLQLASGKISRVVSTPFSPTDAQRTIECQSGVQPALWKMQDGRIWFSTIHGVLILNPRSVNRELPPPPVRIEEIQVNGRALDPERIGELPPGRTNVSFRYTALSFASPTRVAFRYKLEGFDRKWIDAGARREAFYTNLPPSQYRFRVAAANPGDPWTEADRPVEFTVDPHFYQTRWFLPLAIGCVALSIWGVFRLRVLQVKARWNAVLAERSRIARELHDTLIQGFSGVTMQMQALAARLRAPERGALEEIIEDAGYSLREARRSVGGLRAAGGKASGLAEAIAQAARQLTETRDLRLVLRLDSNVPLLPADAEYNVLRIAQEAVTNVLQHAEAREVEVRLESTPDDLHLVVRDDGKGCPAAELVQPRAGHYGLIGMRERASQIQGDLRLESEPGRGTNVSLTLPLAALAPRLESRL